MNIRENERVSSDKLLSFDDSGKHHYSVGSEGCFKNAGVSIVSPDSKLIEGSITLLTFMYTLNSPLTRETRSRDSDLTSR